MEVWVLCLALWPCVAGTPSPCLRAPPHAQPADGRYRLQVAGDPDLYLPGELYTVTLQGVDSGQGPTPFVGFTIWAELDEAVEAEVDVLTSPSRVNHSLGTFQAYDAQAKLRDVCTPSVDNATAHPKTEVQVIWSAPAAASATAACVRLCAQTGPGHTGPAQTSPGQTTLARKLCAAPAAPAAIARQPPILEPCCACDEAKYEVTFEGLWSRNTHPKDFPPESARAHFGDVIGASHTARYRVWQQGRVAGAGLRRLADDGVTTAQEKELKAESDHIRTIIKARGISWQQIASRTATPSTFAVFRVDAKHHLVSLASKLAPSPDWFVGVSALELCNANCTWSEFAMMPLYPYDAGTDTGITYMSRRQPSVPASPVRALRPEWPRDVRSPFYNADGEMRPFARLKFTRLRLYEKSCETAEPPPSLDLSGGSCAVLPWGAWGACSVTCGVGRAARQRQYAWPARAYKDACRAPLTQYKRCYGPRMHCRAPTEYEPDPAESTGPCAVSQWSEWSPCEGCGVRARTRHYLAERAHKRCHVGLRASTVMSQAMPCDAGPCHRPPGTANASNFDWFFVDNPVGECSVSAWGPWSPCSAACGRGRRVRTRLYTAGDAGGAPGAAAGAGGGLQAALGRRLLRQWNQRFTQLQGIELPPENVTSEDPEIESKVLEHLDRCQYTLTMQEALCDGEDSSCLNASDAHEVCKLSAAVGHCRGYEERWFHDAATGKCEPFGFTGCGGNRNNFRTQEACKRVCRNNTVATTSASEPSTKSVKVTARPTTPTGANNEVMQNDAPAPATGEGVDCELSAWRGWSECFGDCHYALKLNYRLALRVSSGAGKPCAKLVKSRVCKPHYCRKNHTTVDTDGSHDSYDDV